MNKLLAVTVCTFLTSQVCADTTIYETHNAEGVPSFTNIPDQGAPDKTITISNEQPMSGNQFNQERAQATEQQAASNNANRQQINENLAQLKSRLNQSQINLEQAQANLKQAKLAQDRGETRIAGDQFIDDNYIRHLEEQVQLAKQQVAVDQENYTNYARDPNLSAEWVAIIYFLEKIKKSIS